MSRRRESAQRERQTLKMRLLVIGMLFLPTMCHALGAEDTEFHALAGNGQALRLTLVDDPKPWSRQNFVYGTPAVRSLSLCWQEAVDEPRASLVCSASKDAAPSLSYEVMGTPDTAPTYGDDTPQGAEYRSIAGKAGLGDGTERGDAVLEAIFACKAGCTPDLPRYIYKVSIYD